MHCLATWRCRAGSWIAERWLVRGGSGVWEQQSRERAKHIKLVRPPIRPPQICRCHQPRIPSDWGRQRLALTFGTLQCVHCSYIARDFVVVTSG
jgi:hypothetical protein